ncbi:MAG: indole-3-glycerol phosphate synthase TrpC [Ignavibacterium sp.]|nr:MAG: indole-3-glycerol phosphate synthase TrpC [Ignavibacterium sp.]
MNFLNEILAAKKTEISKLKGRYTLSSFKDMKFFENNTISLKEALDKSTAISVIAEIKKASPSKGIIKQDFNHIEIASTYFKTGADAVSILTDVNFFKGSIEYLKDIATIKNVPLLRKDFILDEYQIFETKAFGADAALLICEILSKNQIAELTHAANEIDLEVLLELHSENQLGKINYDINKIIGVNNRDLYDFSVDLSTSINISKQLPDFVTVVAESGIENNKDIKTLRKHNIDAILVGEYLMRSANIEETLNQLTQWCRGED